MKLTPIAGAGAVEQFNQTHSTEKARYNNAIKAASGQGTTASTPQQAPPAQQQQHSINVNQNNISPEEMSAVTQTNQVSRVEEALEQTEAPPQPTKEELQARQRFLQLARQEKQVRERELALKQKEADIKALETKYNTPQEIDKSKYISRDQLKQDAFSILAAEGISYEEIAQQYMNQPQRDPRVDAQFSKLEAEIKRLTEENTQAKQNEANKQTQSYQAAVKQIENEVNSLVKSDPTFEAIKAGGHQADVVELITRTYEQDGTLLSTEEAAQLVEDHLIEHYTAITNISKIKQRLVKSQATTTQAPSVKPISEQSQQQPQTKTLTNNIGTSGKLSNRERAILAAKGLLK